MKFGTNLPRNQVPEWSNSYINYKALKRLIKNAVESQNRQDETDLTPFFYSLDRNLEIVDSFFNKRLAEYTRRLKLLQSRYSPENSDSPTVPEDLDRDELEELVGALLELRSGLRKVSWYGEVNRRGFVKILKKVDKKTGVCAQKRYLDTKVLLKPFANCTEVEHAKSTVNAWLSKVGESDLLLGRDDDEKKSDGNTPKHNTPHLLMRTVSSGSVNGIPEGMVDTVDHSIREDNAAILSEVLLETSGLAKMSTSATGECIKDPITQRLLLNLLQRAISSRAYGCIDLLLGQIETLDEADDIHERNVIHRLVIAIGRSKSKLADSDTSSGSGISIGNIRHADSHTNGTNGGMGNLSICVLLQVPEQPFSITPAESPMSTPPTSVHQFELDGSLKLAAHDESVKLLRYLLEHLRPLQRSGLSAKDTYGRTPLHYAAQYGFLVICQVVTRYMREWGQVEITHEIDSARWQDADGLAPLHLAVMNGHPKTTRFLLQSETWDGPSVSETDKPKYSKKIISASSAVLQMAVRANATVIVKLLVGAGINLNYQDEHGETALHLAARLGFSDCVRVLLAGNGSGQGVDVEIAENAYEWTPLFSAAVDGKLEVVQLLVEEGSAEVTRIDLSGWTAIEHAALRGHLDVTRYLKKKMPIAITPISTEATNGSNTGIGDPTGSIGISGEKNSSTSSISSYSSLGTSPPNPSYLAPKTLVSNGDGVKSFGHRYLKTGTTMILVTLGSNDTRKTRSAVNLDRIPLSRAHSTQLDTALSLVISARNAKGDATVIDLPVQHNVSTDELIVFETSNINNVQLLFDIVPTYSGRPDQKIGRAVALLSTIKPSSGKVSLQGGIQVPILSANADAEVIGTVDFDFLIITPFEHERLGVTEKQTYWKSITGPRVIGHRGLGKNLPSRNSLQLGENTIQSFIAAANLGASYVEFDVQLTKDHVPVIYHDFCVGETGIDAPVHTLTLEQFLSVSEHSTPRGSRPGSPDRYNRFPDSSSSANGTNGTNSAPRTASSLLRRTRSMSLKAGDTSQYDAHERMKYTRNYKIKGFKGNSRGTSIQGPFTTLEEVFKRLPSNVGFNIELKYPMLQESEQEEMDTYGIEMNTWVDKVLSVVYDHSKGRDIIFSSFNPDICLMLSFKQPSIPILFLTEGGTAKMADVRASSLQEAIRFASRWNLLGIVSAAEPLILCPRLVRIVKESGLVCVTYGVLNNAPENVKLQVDQGVDAVIVDSVLAIRKGLTAAGVSSGTADKKPSSAMEQKIVATKREVAQALEAATD